jgi:hypothetical protein
VYVAKGNQLFGRPSQQSFGIKELWAKNYGGSTMGDKLLVVTNKVVQCYLCCLKDLQLSKKNQHICHV